MRRLKSFVLLGAIGLGTMLWAQAPQDDEATRRAQAAENLRQIGEAFRAYAAEEVKPYPHPTTRAGADLELLLEKRLPEVRFEDATLESVIRSLRELTGADIEVNWRVLKPAAVTPDTKVSVSLHNVRFGKALDVIVEQVGREKIAYDIDDTTLCISSPDDLGELLETRVYDVRDLVAEHLAILGSPATQPTPAMEHNDHPNFVTAVVELIHTITNTVARDSWVDNGGKAGSVGVFAGRLIVTQTPAHQRQIAGLLARLREGDEP